MTPQSRWRLIVMMQILVIALVWIGFERAYQLLKARHWFSALIKASEP